MQIDLSTPEGYDIACVMRGPDPYAWGLKAVFTARLRALAGCCAIGTFVRRGKVPEDTAIQLQKELAAVSWDARQHYLGHVYQAGTHLGALELARLAHECSLGIPDIERIIELAGGD